MRLTVLLVCAVLAGCASYERRDAPWDPAHPGAMLQQLPNWDREADIVCAGHVDPRLRLPHQSGSC